jgi:hypothetical protein
LTPDSVYQTLTRCLDYLTDDVQVETEMALAAHAIEAFHLKPESFICDVTSTFVESEGETVIFQYGYSRAIAAAKTIIAIIWTTTIKAVIPPKTSTKSDAENPNAASYMSVRNKITRSPGENAPGFTCVLVSSIVATTESPTKDMTMKTTSLMPRDCPAAVCTPGMTMAIPNPMAVNGSICLSN